MLTDEQIIKIGDQLDNEDGRPLDVLLWNREFARRVIDTHEQSKWMRFNEEDRSTWPEAFVQVVTNDGIASYDGERWKDINGDDAHFVEIWQSYPPLPCDTKENCRYRSSERAWRETV